jgi:hypothetical protein
MLINLIVGMAAINLKSFVDLREQTADHATGALSIPLLLEVLPEVAPPVPECLAAGGGPRGRARHAPPAPGPGRGGLGQRREANAALTAWPRR